MFQRFSNIVKWYNTYLNNYPLLTNAVTGFTIAVAGDIACQYYEQKYDASRSVRFHTDDLISDKDDKGKVNIYLRRAIEMGGIRAVVIVPFIMVWYPFLVRACPGTSLPRVLGRVCIDQALGSPIVIGLVFLSNGILQGDIPTSIHRIRTQGLYAWWAGLHYWPIVHTFNFGLVPLQHQALFAHVASLYWNAILSYYSNKGESVTIDR